MTCRRLRSPGGWWCRSRPGGRTYDPRFARGWRGARDRGVVCRGRLYHLPRGRLRHRRG